MKQPIVSPAFLALVCPSKIKPGARASFTEQAKATGFTKRHFMRAIARPWTWWRIGNAARWCAFCGSFDFWDLPGTAVPPEHLRFEKWYPVTTPRIRHALESSLIVRGLKPNNAKIEEMARLLQRFVDQHAINRFQATPSQAPVGTEARSPAT